jgi:hypothetical protein
MSREEVTSFLLNLQLCIRELDKDIDTALKLLPEVKREDLPRWLENERCKYTAVQQDLMNDWDAFTKSYQDTSNQRSPHCIDADRLRRLGAIPALGGGVVLPKIKSTSKDVTSLTTAASPAAVEILRSKLDNSSSPLRSVATTTSKAGDGEPHQTTTTTTQPFNVALRPTTKGRLKEETSPVSELASALQKRLNSQ